MKKKDERETIESMIIKPKHASEKKDKKNFNAIINRIINYLRKKDRICTLNEISKDLDKKHKEKY